MKFLLGIKKSPRSQLRVGPSTTLYVPNTILCTLDNSLLGDIVLVDVLLCHNMPNILDARHFSLFRSRPVGICNFLTD